MKNLKLLVVLVLMAPLAGCDAWLDIDRDPTAADEVPPALIFIHTIANLGSNRAIEIGPGPQMWAQAWVSGRSTSVLIESEQYAISTFTTGNTWRNYYRDGIKNLNVMIRDAQASDPVLNNQAAQGKLLQAFIFYNLTMLWEDVPFDDAGLLHEDIEFAQPTYNTQREVLQGVIGLVNEALAQMDDSPAVGARDVIYNGNMQNWTRFGNALKLQALMFLRSGGEAVGGQIDALMALGDNQMLRQHTSNAYIPFQPPTPSPRWNLAGLFSGGNWLWTYGSTALVDYMNEQEDPRRPVFFYTNNAGNFVGQLPGVSATSANFSNVHGGRSMSDLGNMIRPNAPDVLLTAHQVLFYEAEVLASRGDLDGADAKYRQAIQQHFNMLGAQFGAVTGGADWIAERPALTGMSQQDALHEVQRQHFVSLFNQSPEVWNHIRRTGELPGINRVLPVGADTDGFLNRLPYPPVETTTHPNMPAPRSRTAPMWFQGGN